VRIDELADFVADRRERAVLDLDQPPFGHHVDAIAVAGDFGPRVTHRVQSLELAIARRFHTVP